MDKFFIQDSEDSYIMFLNLVGKMELYISYLRYNMKNLQGLLYIISFQLNPKK